MEFYNPRPDGNFIADKVLKWIADIAVVAMMALFAAIFLCEETNIVGSSMSPVLSDGQTVLIDKISYEMSEPDRFDVIVYKSDINENQYVIKRIIGLPGEKVKIEDSRIYIDGKVIEDEYFKGTYESGSAGEEITLGSDEYFVMGDNRNLSEDSRFSYIGNIKAENIVGKAWLISAPFGDIGFVE